MSITPEALFKYFKSLLKKPAVVELLSQTSKVFKPVFKIVPSCGTRFGGLCWGAGTLEISSWILADANVAKGVVRHELAHAIQEHLNIQGRPHGKEFIQLLKTVSPNRWRKDRHWQPTNPILKARNYIHPNGERRMIKPLTNYRTFTVEVR